MIFSSGSQTKNFKGKLRIVYSLKKCYATRTRKKRLTLGLTKLERSTEILTTEKYLLQTKFADPYSRESQGKSVILKILTLHSHFS